MDVGSPGVLWEPPQSRCSEYPGVYFFGLAPPSPAPEINIAHPERDVGGTASRPKIPKPPLCTVVEGQGALEAAFAASPLAVWDAAPITEQMGRPLLLQKRPLVRRGMKTSRHARVALSLNWTQHLV